MRSWTVAALVVIAGAVPALGQGAQPSPKPKPSQGQTARVSNDAAQREAAAREKRWDERMKRTTRSMCVGC